MAWNICRCHKIEDKISFQSVVDFGVWQVVGNYSRGKLWNKLFRDVYRKSVLMVLKMKFPVAGYLHRKRALTGQGIFRIALKD